MHICIKKKVEIQAVKIIKKDSKIGILHKKIEHAVEVENINVLLKRNFLTKQAMLFKFSNAS